jgi:feruloyl-CoA synthase
MMHDRQSRPGSATDDAPYRPIAFGAVDIACERTSGALYLRARTPLAAHDPSLARLFRAAVEAQPARLFLAERDGAGWRGVTYEEARRSVDALAQALIERGLSAERPVMILSGNAIDHALLMLAGFSAGIAVAPISPAYSLQSQDHAKLKHIAELIDPGVVYVADTAPFAKALAALALERAEVAASRNGANRDGVTLFQELTETRPGPALEQAVSSISADTIAKFLFTSGSTTLPKGVVNTHGMLTSNQQALAQIWPFLSAEPLVLVDWLPWNHTFGGNHNLNLVLRHAGTLYIDGGKPVPALVGETVRNLAEVSPTIYFNVPAGFAAVLPHLERDAALARTFFARLRLIFYAGAALPDDLWERLEALSARTTGSRVPMTSSWGTTETAPLATAAPFVVRQPGVVGVPVPGVELKLVATRSKLEVRVRGPNVTPGYWRRPDLTLAAFDEEGFYKPGDAMRFVDATDPRKGLAFDGRLAEDFKLATGTWVHVGALRVGILAAASPALADAVVAGENRTCVGLLAWLNAAGCQKLLAAEPPLSFPELARMPAVREHVRAALARWNREHLGSSHCVGRVLLLADPPSIDANEITDKGYINQRLALERRLAEVARLYADCDPDVIVIEP